MINIKILLEKIDRVIKFIVSQKVMYYIILMQWTKVVEKWGHEGAIDQDII